MTEAVPRAVVEAYYKAYSARDARAVAEFLDDNVKWTVSGPVDVLPFCGKRHGKARLAAKRAVDGRVIRYRLAHFYALSWGQGDRKPSLLDSFDAVEQILGRPIEVYDRSSAGHSAAV